MRWFAKVALRVHGRIRYRTNDVTHTDDEGGLLGQGKIQDRLSRLRPEGETDGTDALLNYAHLDLLVITFFYSKTNNKNY
jgi:hypothetical protein